MIQDGKVIAAAEADPSGNYTLLLQQTGTFTLQASGEHGTFEPLVDLVVNSSDQLTRNVASGTASLAVTVEGPGGLDLSLAEVDLYSPTGVWFKAAVDVTNKATFNNLAPGVYTVRATVGTTHAVTQSFTVTAGATETTTATVAETSTVSGAITLDGAAGEGLFVELNEEGGNHRYFAVVDENGRYEINFVTNATYTLAVHGAGAERTERAAVSVSGNTTRDLAVTVATAFVGGRVLNGLGDPVPEALLTLVDSTGNVLGYASTALDGTFRVEAVAAADLTLEFSAIGFAPAEVAGVTAVVGDTSVGDISLTGIGVGLVGDPVSQSTSTIQSADAPQVAMLSPVFDWMFDVGNWFADPAKIPEHVDLLDIKTPDFDNPCEAACVDEWTAALDALAIQDVKWDAVEADVSVVFWSKVDWAARWTRLVADGANTVLSLATPVGEALEASGKLLQFIEGPTERATVNQIRTFLNGFVGSAAQSAALVGNSADARDGIAQANNMLQKVADWSQDLVGFTKAIEDDMADLLDVGQNAGYAAYANLLTALSAVRAVLSDLPKQYEDIGSLSKEIDDAVETANQAYREYDLAARTARVRANVSNTSVLQASQMDPGDCLDNDDDHDDGDHDDQNMTEFPISLDPNDILGPRGYAEERWIAAVEPAHYTIRFENDPVLATAPAQVVRITVQLDSNLDLQSFRVGDFGFGMTVVDVPDNRASYFGRIDVTDELGVFVDVMAGVNPHTREAFWEFTSIDPATGDIPTDALTGFLPPNLGSPEGEGFVRYSALARATVASGDRVDAAARVIFDSNEPIDTPPIFNTIDAGIPQVTVNPLPVATLEKEFTVTWEGADDPGGSGLAHYTIFVSENGGLPQPWLEHTKLSQAPFTGQELHRYAFFSVAFDNAGNQETLPVDAETQVIVSGPPGVTVTPTSGLVTSEAGATAAFTVVLNGMPTDDVVIDVASGDTSEGSVSVDRLTFTPDNWFTPQTVTVSGEDDDIDDDDTSYTILLGPITSNDADYRAIDPDDVTVTNTDDDTIAVVVARHIFYNNSLL